MLGCCEQVWLAFLGERVLLAYEGGNEYVLFIYVDMEQLLSTIFLHCVFHRITDLPSLLAWLNLFLCLIYAHVGY